jgi:uncharacterized membrane protein YkoI
MARHTLTAAAVLLGALLAMNPPAFAQSTQQSRDEAGTPIQLSEVPPPVLSAARHHLGGQVKEAHLVEDPAGRGQQVYELTGTDKHGKAMSIHVTANGTIVKTEH